MFMKLTLAIVLFTALSVQAQEVVISQKNRAVVESNSSLQSVTNYVDSETTRIQQIANAAIISADALMAKLNTQAGADCPADMHFMRGTGSSGALSCERFVVTTFPVSQDCDGKYCGAQYYACGLTTVVGQRRSTTQTSCTLYDAAKLNADYLCRTWGKLRAATFTTKTIPYSYASYRVGRGGGMQVNEPGAASSPGGVGTAMNHSSYSSSGTPQLSHSVLATVKCTN